MEQRVEDIREFVEDAATFANELGEAALASPLTNAAYRAFCSVAAGSPTQGVFDAVDLGTVCTPYLQQLGREFGRDVVPLQGGQCAETRYRVSFVSVTYIDDNSSGTETLNIGGALQGFGPITVSAVGPNLWRYETAEGTLSDIVVNDNASNPNPIIQSVEVNLTILNGGPDDCGDAPPIFVPGEGYGGEGYGSPFEVEGPDGNNLPVTVEPPTLGPDGGISIPVTIDGVNINLGPSDSGGGDGAGGYNPGPTSTGTPTAAGPDDGPQDVPEGPPGSKCIAVAVVATGSPDSAGEVSGSLPPKRTFGVLGSLFLELETEEGFVFWGEVSTLSQERTVKAIPVEGLVISRWLLVLRPGMTATVTPIYRQDEEVAEGQA